MNRTSTAKGKRKVLGDVERASAREDHAQQPSLRRCHWNAPECCVDVCLVQVRGNASAGSELVDRSDQIVDTIM